MLRNIITGVAVVAFAASVSAQSQTPVQKAVTPKYAGTYKVASGEFVPSSTNRANPPAVVIYNNTTATNYYSVPGANQEWIDEGVLNDRNNCDRDQINCFEVIYCSSDIAASGTIIYTFYDETIECTGPTGGVPGTPDCSYALSGLPLGTPTGALQCWIVTVDLAGVECPDNTAQSFDTTGQHPANPLFGWGTLPQVGNTGPWIRRGGKGTVNDFVWYDRTAGTNVGCFWFGGVPFASFSMKMWGPQANGIVYNDNDANAANCRWGNNNLDTIRLTANLPAVAGQNCSWSVAPTAAGQTYWFVASLAPICQNVNNANGTFTLLINPNPLAPTPVQMPGGTLAAGIPANMPARVYIQAFCTVGALNAANVQAASNGICMCF